jgi:magnesium and cobalt transporter
VSDSSESTSSRHHHPANGDNREDKRSFWQRITEFISHGPESKQDLIEILAGAEDKQVINAESRIMLEGVLRMAEMTVADVMVAAPRMDMLDIDAPYDALLNLVIETAHSRFPVYEDQRDNIIGILLAKDLLKLQRAPELNLRALLRAPMFVPESKGLNDLLREFRSHHNHQAIVIDEFGRVAGLITIEDVLEEIVGEIEDEFDTEEDHGDIFGLADGTHRVSGDTPIEQFNQSFEVTLPVDEFDTVGGLVAHEMGHVPRRGEAYEMAGLRLVVMHTKGGAVRWFKVMSLDQRDRDS